MVEPSSYSHFEIVDAQDINPISDIYNLGKLFDASRRTNMMDARLANGIIARKAGKFYDLAGRHRNFSATLFAHERNYGGCIFIPVNVVDSVEDAVRIYKHLLSKSSFPLNEIDEKIETRWDMLERKSDAMCSLGYKSLAHVVEKHQLRNRYVAPHVEPTLF